MHVRSSPHATYDHCSNKSPSPQCMCAAPHTRGIERRLSKKRKRPGSAQSLRAAASTAPRPTYARRSRRSLALALNAAMPHRLRKIRVSTARTSSGTVWFAAVRWQVHPKSTACPSSQLTCGDASAQEPNTSPRTSPKLRSLRSTHMNINNPCLKLSADLLAIPVGSKNL